MSKLLYSHTDEERLNILKSAYYSLSSDENFADIISGEKLKRIENHYEMFEKITEYKSIMQQRQNKEDENYKNCLDKADLYLTHFFKALYMAIERGELPENITEFYGLTYPFNIPTPKDEDELLQIARKLFVDDDKRVGEGGKYFANPSIGSIKVWIDKFSEAYQKKTNAYNIKQAKIENIGKIRNEADSLILGLHKAIDDHNSELCFEDLQLIFSKYGMQVEIGENIDSLEETIVLNKHEDFSSPNQLSLNLFQ